MKVSFYHPPPQMVMFLLCFFPLNVKIIVIVIKIGNPNKNRKNQSHRLRLYDLPPSLSDSMSRVRSGGRKSIMTLWTQSGTLPAPPPSVPILTMLPTGPVRSPSKCGSGRRNEWIHRSDKPRHRHQNCSGDLSCVHQQNLSQLWKKWPQVCHNPSFPGMCL